MFDQENELQAAVPAPTPVKAAPSEARLRANRLNAQNSKGPTSPEGKKRSCLNATRHGILSQTVHFPEEEMKAYTEFCERYVAGLQPSECSKPNSPTPAPISSSACIVALPPSTTCSPSASKKRQPLGNRSSRISHRARHGRNASFKRESHRHAFSLRAAHQSPLPANIEGQLREIQAERRSLEQTQLKELCLIAASHPEEIENITPERFGFVCSSRDWAFYRDRSSLRKSRPSRDRKGQTAL